MHYGERPECFGVGSIGLDKLLTLAIVIVSKDWKAENTHTVMRCNALFFFCHRFLPILAIEFHSSHCSFRSPKPGRAHQDFSMLMIPRKQEKRSGGSKRKRVLLSYYYFTLFTKFGKHS